MSDVKFTDNSDQVKAAFEAAILRALEQIGTTVEGRTKENAPVDTGRLKESITHAVAEDENAVYVGVPVEPDGPEYGKYQELGTSKMSAHPFLKPAVLDSVNDMKTIVEGSLKDDESLLSMLRKSVKEGWQEGRDAGEKFGKGLDKLKK